VDETGLLKGISGAAPSWRALDACGIADVLGVWNHEAGPARRFTAAKTAGEVSEIISLRRSQNDAHRSRLASVT
jgi:hypothetical protein